MHLACWLSQIQFARDGLNCEIACLNGEQPSAGDYYISATCRVWSVHPTASITQTAIIVCRENK